MGTVETPSNWGDEAAAAWTAAKAHAPARALGAPLAMTRLKTGELAFVATPGLVFPEPVGVRLVREFVETDDDGHRVAAHEVTTFRDGVQIGREIGHAPLVDPS